MGIWSGLFRRNVRLTDGGFWASYFGGRNVTGKPVNSDSALTVAAAWACVRLLSESAGILPLFVYKRASDGVSRVVDSKHWAYAMLHTMPNSETPANEFYEAVVACMSTVGNSYAFKVELERGRTVAMTMVHPNDMEVSRWPRTGELRYRFALNGKSQDVGADRIVHFRGFGIGGDVGLSPIRYNANSLGIAMAADDTAGSTFRSGAASLSGFIQTEKALDKQQREDFGKSLRGFQQHDSTSKLMLLENGFKYQAIGIPPEDLQLLQARGFSVEEVCRAFRVPPFMVGHTEKNTSWGSGLEQQLIAFLTFSLLPYLKKIQNRLNAFVLTPEDRAAGYYCEFNLEGLLQADSAARAAFYSIMTQNGLYTRNEVRARENLPAMPGGDVLTVQSNLVPLDKLGALVKSDSNAARNALRDWLDVPDKPPSKESTPAVH